MQTYVYLQMELKERFSKDTKSCRWHLQKNSRNWALTETELWLSQCGLLGKLKMMGLFQCIVEKLMPILCSDSSVAVFFFFSFIWLYLAMPNYPLKIEIRRGWELSAFILSKTWNMAWEMPIIKQLDAWQNIPMYWEILERKTQYRKLQNFSRSRACLEPLKLFI